MDIFSTIILTLAVVLALFWLRRRAKSTVGLDSFVTAVTEAADAGDQAYRGQVKTLSRHRGQLVDVAPRGLALARLLCALFPTAAFVVVDAGGALLPSVKRHAPFSGKEAWKLASGAALGPLNVTTSHPDFNQIKDDTNRATQAYVDYFNTKFKGDPLGDLAAAEIHLAPLWQEALELSLGPTDKNLHTTQFCTAGLHLFVDWFQVLGKKS